MLYGSGRLLQEWYDRILRPRSGTSTPTTRSPTPRVVRSTTSPKKRHKHSNSSVAYSKSGTIDYFAQEAAQALQQLGRLPQEWYDQLLRPERDTIIPTTRSPTPRAVRSTTSTREEHKHSNNSVAHPKSGMIKYFAQGAAQTLQQLGRLQQERYDRLRHPRRGTNTPTTRSPTPRAVRSTTSPKERHNQQKQLGRLLQEQYN